MKESKGTLNGMDHNSRTEIRSDKRKIRRRRREKNQTWMQINCAVKRMKIEHWYTCAQYDSLNKFREITTKQLERNKKKQQTNEASSRLFNTEYWNICLRINDWTTHCSVLIANSQCSLWAMCNVCVFTIHSLQRAENAKIASSQILYHYI